MSEVKTGEQGVPQSEPNRQQAEPGTPLLSLRGLTKTITLHILGGTMVTPFRDVSFDVYPGEFVVLAGASGSGKSSVIKTLHRTYLATGGAAHYQCADGRVIDLATAPDREIVALRRGELGFVTQFLKAEPRIPAMDVVAGPLLRRGVDLATAREQARDLLARLDIPERLWQSYPSLFSGGEQQRVNIARALVGRPRLLLADEPTSALDTANIGRVVELLERARREGITILGVFHDRDLIERLADRIVVLHEGILIAQGRAGEVTIPRGDQRQEFAPRV